MPATIVDVPFPKSSMPGQQPGEGQGRLTNTYCEMDGGVPTWRPVPGLVEFTNIPNASGPRGAIVVGNFAYVAMADYAYNIAPSGDVQLFSGGLDGTLPVTWAQNNKFPTNDVIAVTENDVYTVSFTAIEPLGEGNLPTRPLDVSQLDGYFLYLYQDGNIYASDLNETSVNALSYVVCRAGPGYGIRGFAYGSQYFACFTDRIEVFQDAATQPFPLARQAVIPCGIAGKWAVTGIEPGWDQTPFFVAADNTVRQLQGYQVPVVSNKDVDRAIQSVTDKTTIRASVHSVAGHPIVTISSPTFTWEYNVSTQFWHERKSFGLDRWRGEAAFRFREKWIACDIQSGKLFEITEAAFDEDGEPLSWIAESGPVKQFPSRLQPFTGWFDFSTGQGTLSGITDWVDPQVEIETSKDGGGTWRTTAVRSIGKHGEYDRPIRVNRIAGTTSQHGLRVPLTSSSPIFKSFRGGRLEVDQRAPN